MNTIIARLSPYKPITIKNILVIKLDHIGDQVLALPALKLLRTYFSDARIVGLIGEWSKDIAEYSGVFDEVVTYKFYREDRGALPEINYEKEKALSEQLKKYEFDLALDLRRQPETRRFLALSGAKIKVGYTSGTEVDGSLDIFIKLYPDIPGEKNIHNKMNSSIQLLELVKKVIEHVIPADFLSVKIPENELIKARELLENVGINFSKRPIIGMHPGATHPAKQWGAENFMGLADRLLKAVGGQIIIFGTDEESAISEAILKNNKEKSIVDLTGRISLKEYMGCVQLLDLIVGNDNGGMHIAGAEGIPAITIFGGRETPFEWATYSPNSLCLYREMFCSPCHLDNFTECKYNYECIKKIDIEDVLYAVKYLLNNQRHLNSTHYFLVRDETHIPEVIREISPKKYNSISSKKKIIISYFAIVEDDAIGNDCVEEYRVLKENGFDVYLYAERVDGAYRDMLIKDTDFINDKNSILIYHHGNYWRSGAELIRNFKGLAVIKYHNITPPYFFKNYSKELSELNESGRRQTKELLQNSSVQVVLCASHFNAQDIYEEGFDSKRVYIVPPFHRIEEFDLLEGNTSILQNMIDGKANILHVGRISPNKGLLHLINVMRTFQKLFNDNFRLLIVGGLDPRLNAYFRELTDMVKRNGLANKVIFTGRVSRRDLKSYYISSHVFLLMSEHEGFCVPVLEAQNFKLPLVALKRGAVPETIGEDQLLLDEVDYEKFSAAIYTLVKDSSIREFLIEKGSKNFLRYNREELRRTFLDCLKEFL